MSLKQISEDDPTGSEVMNLKEFIKSMELVERKPGSRASSAESSKPQTPSTKGPPKGPLTKRASAFELIGKKMTSAGSKEKGLDKDNFTSLDDVGKAAEEEAAKEAKEKLQKVARSAAYVKNIKKMESVPAGLGNGIATSK